MNIQSGMNLQDAARAAGVSRRTVSRWRRTDQWFHHQVNIQKMLAKVDRMIEKSRKDTEGFEHGYLGT